MAGINQAGESKDITGLLPRPHLACVQLSVDVCQHVYNDNKPQSLPIDD